METFSPTKDNSFDSACDEKLQKEYVISKPPDFSLSTGTTQDIIQNLENEVKVIGSLPKVEDKLVLLNDDELERIEAKLPGFTIEPNIFYEKFGHPLLIGFETLKSTSLLETKDITFQISNSRGIGIPSVTVVLRLDVQNNIGFEGITDKDGACVIKVPQNQDNFDDLLLLPRHSYWNRRIPYIEVKDTYETNLRELPCTERGDYDWGHSFANMRDDFGVEGEGVVVGVIDTGICKDHPGLAPEGGRNCVYGEDPNLWHVDTNGHGTHCAGIISAVVNSGIGVKGYAPKIKLRSYRVFSSTSRRATTYDIMGAILQAVEDGCDIINMSLGSPIAQSAIRTKMEYAHENGVLCVAATGNDAGGVNFPAALPTVVGVGAFGKYNTYPDDSLHKHTESTLKSNDEQYFLAGFSNHGDYLNFCAPGVAITSTVPGGYAAWDGTSMACPQVVGIAALTLASHPEILNSARDSNRVDQLLKILSNGAQSLGFGAGYEGIGCLRLGK